MYRAKKLSRNKKKSITKTFYGGKSWRHQKEDKTFAHYDTQRRTWLTASCSHLAFMPGQAVEGRRRNADGKAYFCALHRGARVTYWHVPEDARPQTDPGGQTWIIQWDWLVLYEVNLFKEAWKALMLQWYMTMCEQKKDFFWRKKMGRKIHRILLKSLKSNHQTFLTIVFTDVDKTAGSPLWMI